MSGNGTPFSGAPSHPAGRPTLIVNTGSSLPGPVKPGTTTHQHESPEVDLYRTFSPTEVAFWHFDNMRKNGGPSDDSKGGAPSFWSKLFGKA